MTRMCSGLIDKLYWRQIGNYFRCFSKEKTTTNGRHTHVFFSLCENYSLVVVGGQSCARPKVHFRCGICDGREMARRGWEESGPES